MSKELIKKFLISLNENKAQEAKKYLSEAIKVKVAQAKLEAERIVEGKKKTKKLAKKQSTHMGKPSITKPKLLKFSKKIKENIEGERTRFTVQPKGESGVVSDNFMSLLREKNIDARFNEDTKNYCVPSEQWEETKNILSANNYIATPVISMEDTDTQEGYKHLSDIEKEVSMEDIDGVEMTDETEEGESENDREDVDMYDQEDTYQSDDRKDKLRQSISDIRTKMSI